jgi:hypothetical protein
LRWIALLVNSMGLLLTADIPLAILNIVTNQMHLGTAGIFAQMLTVVLIRPASLILLVMSIFLSLGISAARISPGKNIIAPG